MYLTYRSLWILRKPPFSRSVLLHTRKQVTVNHKFQENKISSRLTLPFLVKKYGSSRLRIAKGVDGIADWDSGMDEYLRVALLAAKKAGVALVTGLIYCSRFI